MLVKAKWNIKDSSGWHSAGEVFNTETDLGDAVTVLEPAAKPEEKEPEQETAPAEKAPAKARTASRRRVSK